MDHVNVNVSGCNNSTDQGTSTLSCRFKLVFPGVLDWFNNFAKISNENVNYTKGVQHKYFCICSK